MRPSDTEYAPFYASYIARVPETDPLPALEAQPAELHTLADRVTPGRRDLSATRLGKWSVRQIVRPSDRHRTGDGLSRVLHWARRSEAAARASTKRSTSHAPIPTTDRSRSWRTSLPRSVTQTSGSSGAGNRKTGIASATRTASAVSARAIAYIMAGHVRHHIALLRERYGLEV